MNALHVRFACAAALAAAPSVAQWAAIPAAGATAPSERTNALMAYDLLNNRTLLFGGNWTNEFWSLQNDTWTQLTPAVLPSGRIRADLAADTLNGTILLYGGDTGGTARLADDETWLFNGSVWAQLQPAVTPGGFAKHCMAYDVLRATTVLFGGRRDSWIPQLHSAQTWEFVGGNWSMATPALSPPARVGAAMSYHIGRNDVIMFGGEDATGNGMDDTWSYDGTTWTQINTTGPRPSPRSEAKMVPILNRSICVLFGGREPFTAVIANDTWEHDGTNWNLVPTVRTGISPPRAEFAMSHDLARDRLVLFGGRIANNAPQNDTWEFGAHFLPFGNGCAGSAGVPSLSSLLLPRLGSVCSARLSNLKPTSTIALFAVGLSRTQSQFGALPSLLTGFGLPGCRAYTSSDLITVLGANGGIANWSWNVPAWSGFIGQEFHLQGLSVDPGVNAAGLTVSNAATIVIGV